MKKYFLVIVLLAVFIVKAQKIRTSPIYQLRIYEIFENNKKEFHERFGDHAMRIMKKYNFKIISIYESKSDKKTEFVYFLEWPDEAAMKKAWEDFRKDQEWIDIKKLYTAKYGDVIGNIEDRVLGKLDYSPN
ncbi:NIPSNAP family protein [Flavobacterium sp. B11]|uniref:NIPSNAP family protein n=1 Tax=Flavobacterium movens TaxID=214860 RepID=UPI0031D73956